MSGCVPPDYCLTALLILNPLGKGQERILLRGETRIMEKVFQVKVINDTCTVPRVMSRKKDFIPAIGQVLSGAIQAASGGSKPR